MTFEDYALIQRELGFIAGILYNIDKNGDMYKSVNTISSICKKAVTASRIDNKKAVTPPVRKPSK